MIPDNCSSMIKNCNRYEMGWQVLSFNQECVTPYFLDGIETLGEYFGGSVISRNVAVIWPQRSCDLTLFGYFLWRYSQSLIYSKEPWNSVALKFNIESCINGIKLRLLQKVTKIGFIEFDICKRSHDEHLNDVEFEI